MQYKSNPANDFQDIGRKLNLVSTIIKVINGIKIEGRKKVKGHSPQEAHLQPLRDVCVKYENNLANGSRDIVRNEKTLTHVWMAGQTDMLTTISPTVIRGRE